VSNYRQWGMFNPKGKQDAESELTRPHKQVGLLVRYGFMFLLLLAVEMALVGRWLFVIPLIAVGVSFIWGTLGAAITWGVMLLVVGVPALFGWWPGIYWHMDTGMVNYISLDGVAWFAYPAALMWVRWLLMLWLPFILGLPMSLGYIRYAVEVVLPELSNTSWLEYWRGRQIRHGIQPQPEPEPEQKPVEIPYGYALKQLPQRTTGETWFFGAFPQDVLDLIDHDEIVAADTVRDMFSALLSGATYSRPEWCKRRKVLTQSAWHALNSWMVREGHAKLLPGNVHVITRGGMAMMQAVVDAIDQQVI